MTIQHVEIGLKTRPLALAWSRRAEEARALVRLATPITLIALVNMGMSVTDTVMVSALFGTGALAAVAVGSDFYSIIFYLSAGVVGGIAPFYAAAHARADGVEMLRLRRIGWIIVGLLAALTVPTVWFAPAWLQNFGIEPALLEAGEGFTRAMALTLIPMLGMTLYRTILTASEKPKVFLKVTLTMLVLNALANYVLMVGVGPLPGFGPAGSGIATLLVACAGLAMLAAVARQSSPDIATSENATPDWHSIAAVLRVGVPIGIATLAEVGIFLAATLYAATLGAAAVAAHTLTLRTAGVAYAVPAALLQASLVRMARAQAIGQPDAGRSVIASSLGLSLVSGTAICLALAAAAGPLANAFFDDSAAGTAAAQIAFGLLLVLAVLEIAANPGSAASGLLRGRKDAGVAMINVLIGNWAVGAPLGIYLCEVQGWGVTGLWTGLAAGTLVSAVLSLARVLVRR